mgnify:CR=1 FL=1
MLFGALKKVTQHIAGYLVLLRALANRYGKIRLRWEWGSQLC